MRPPGRPRKVADAAMWLERVEPRFAYSVLDWHVRYWWPGMLLQDADRHSTACSEAIIGVR